MSTTRPQQHRIRRILEPIRAGCHTGRLANARSFAQELGASRQTIVRDLDYLRDDLNAPIEYVPARHGYRLSDPTWALPALQVSRREGTYLLDPYHLVAYHGDWYLLAYHHRRGQVATFALSRIRSVRFTGSVFEVQDNVDPEGWLREGFGITGGEKPIRVRLLFSPKVATYIRERTWHPSQETVDRRDGGVELRFETTGWKELVRFVLSWQPDVKVLSPKRLRDRIREKMEAALAE